MFGILNIRKLRIRKKIFFLFIAAYKSNKEIVDLLISKRVDFNQQDVNGNTALILGIL